MVVVSVLDILYIIVFQFNFTCTIAVGAPSRVASEDLIEDMKVYIPMCPQCPQCIPYSEQACIVAILSNGFQIASMKTTGYLWKGAWSYKGCMVYTSGSYKGFAFYGTGGTPEQMQLPVSDGLRPKGYDCN